MQITYPDIQDIFRTSTRTLTPRMLFTGITSITHKDGLITDSIRFRVDAHLPTLRNVLQSITGRFWYRSPKVCRLVWCGSAEFGTLKHSPSPYLHFHLVIYHPFQDNQEASTALHRVWCDYWGWSQNKKYITDTQEIQDTDALLTFSKYALKGYNIDIYDADAHAIPII